MGSEETELEVPTEGESKEAKQPVVEKEPPVEQHSEPPSESPDPVDVYNWHTSPKGTPGPAKGDGGANAAASPMDKAQKSSATRWSRIQNWRKGLSDDFSDRPLSSSPASPAGKSGAGVKPEGVKPEKMHGHRKSPFRRALSEPTGSLFSVLTSSSSSSHVTPSTMTTEASGASPMDASQRGGGGALFRKCLKTVSQKLKRPRLQSRHSTHTLLAGNVF